MIEVLAWQWLEHPLGRDWEVRIAELTQKDACAACLGFASTVDLLVWYTDF